MATLIKGKNANKPYTVRFWADGRQRERSFVTLKEARDFKAKAEHDIRAQIFTDPKLGAVKFTDYAEQWIASRKTPNTQRIYEHALRTHVTPSVNGRTLRQVADDRESMERLLTGLSVSAQRAVVTLVIGTMNTAVKAGRIPSHRLRGLAVGHANMRAEIIHASHGQLDTIANALPDGYGLTVWLMRGCGLRIGEALAVTPECVRDDGTVLRVDEQIVSTGAKAPLKHRKEGDYRDIPLPAYVAAKMEGWAGFEPINRTTYNRAWRRAATAAGLPVTFTPHTLRHTYASIALHKGMPITEVSRFLGHKSIEITHQVYGYLVPSSFGRTRDAIDDEFKDWSNEVDA
jgi:integrase